MPVVSKIPLLDRLFRNVGIGRTTNSVMLMVTPRIIILEEEEEASASRRSPSDSDEARIGLVEVKLYPEQRAAGNHSGGPFLLRGRQPITAVARRCSDRRGHPLDRRASFRDAT